MSALQIRECSEERNKDQSKGSICTGDVMQFLWEIPFLFSGGRLNSSRNKRLLYIKITGGEKFPKLEIVRQEDDKK